MKNTDFNLKLASCLLVTSRLYLRTYTVEDFDFLYKKIFSDKVVMQWLLSAKPLTRVETESIINKYFPCIFKPYGLGILCVKNTCEPIGYAGFIKCDYLGHNDYEIGFALKTSAWGKGYAYEIGKAQTEFALINMKLERILALTHPQNQKSASVIKKLSYKYYKEIFVNERGPRLVFVKKNL